MGVLNWLFPRDETFYKLLEKQSKLALKSAETFRTLVNTYNSAIHSKRQRHIRDLKRYEHEGDKLIRELVEKLNKTFITPIDREDIHNLANLLDDIIDAIDNVGNMFYVHNIKKVDKFIKEFSKIIHEGVKEIHLVMHNLRQLKEVEKHCNKLKQLERDADDVLSESIAVLFRENKNAIEIIKYKDVYELMESITDKTCKIGVIIEGIVVKHA
ncbi:DUF47 family protein [Candidatus Woesearchaeota archaeon]|nr:DUF47 family protein [Candidatus Woesearchaeota archaeon]